MSRYPRTRLRLGALVLAGSLGFAACSSDSSTTVSSEPAEAAPLTPAADGASSVPVLDFSAPIINGDGQLDANTLAGTDTIVWFWAPW